MPPVARLLTLIALIACLLWQSQAVAHAAVAPQGDGDLAHAILHWSDEAHHHHDGDIHLDDSDESVSHVMSDHLGGAAAVLPSCAPSLGKFSPGEALPLGAQDQLPSPFLDGLLRPPRA
jgi:hypothetical protein